MYAPAPHPNTLRIAYLRTMLDQEMGNIKGLAETAQTATEQANFARAAEAADRITRASIRAQKHITEMATLDQLSR